MKGLFRKRGGGSLDTVRALLFALHSAMEKGFDVVDLAKI